MCEVVLLDDRFKDLREHVGRANIFWSLMQQERLLCEDALANIAQAQIQIEQHGRVHEGAQPTWAQRALFIGQAQLPSPEHQRV